MVDHMGTKTRNVAPKRPATKRKAPAWVVLLEEIKSQNATTIEAVQVLEAKMDGRFDFVDRRLSEITHRLDSLEMTVGELKEVS